MIRCWPLVCSIDTHTQTKKRDGLFRNEWRQENKHRRDACSRLKWPLNHVSNCDSTHVWNMLWTTRCPPTLNQIKTYLRQPEVARVIRLILSPLSHKLFENNVVSCKIYVSKQTPTVFSIGWLSWDVPGERHPISSCNRTSNNYHTYFFSQKNITELVSRELIRRKHNNEPDTTLYLLLSTPWISTINE